MTHLAIGELLLEIHPELLESSTCGFDVVARYSDVSKSTPRIRVSVCIALEVRIRLRAMVVRQFEDPWVTMALIRRYGNRRIVMQVLLTLSIRAIGLFGLKGVRAVGVIESKEVECEVREFSFY